MNMKYRYPLQKQFFKQKTAYEISLGLVGSEMCIRDRNTPAAVWANQLSEEVKKVRLQEINDLVEKTARSRNQRYINNIESVLIEGLNPKNSSQIMGRTRTNRLTFVEIPKNINFNFSLGDEINVRINEARPFSLTGELSL